ncbi:MAG TPA: 4-hydroxy-tetrahydrodipicolinate reductase [Methylomirabilota bacterium]|nr:4-hydroxy-tetrahydrodipicolinate reductase [Methylomirabilota bacterium]
MAFRVIVAGVTGWTGSAVAKAIAAADDMVLAGAVARGAAGRDAGELLTGEASGVLVRGSVTEALDAGADVLVDYTHPSTVKRHVLEAIEAGVHVIVGTSGLGADDYAEIDERASAAGIGVFASGNFSITAALLSRFALMAARYVPDVEVIDYASGNKPDAPSGTGRELAERLSLVRRPGTALAIDELTGMPATRGATVGAVQVHSVRMPGFVLSCEALFGAADERLSIRHDAGSSAAPYVAGTLLAVRRVPTLVGLVRGLDRILE